jgi:NADPH-dependent 2,4-dienoyl-CoA reductase/sulfur reductase-like enzyme
VAIVIVGASVAGIRTAQALRLQGFEGPITLIGEEPHHPYDKPPLSKDMLTGAAGPVPLLSVDELGKLGVDLKLGLRATGLDPAERTVELADGGRVQYTELVIATGVTPRSLPGIDPVPLGVHTIRTADDALALRAALSGQPQVVIVGAGFIGAEFASAARGYGCAVTIIEAQDVPLAHILGAEVGALLSAVHRANGVQLLTGVRFDRFGTDFVAGGRVSAVALADGRLLPADLVVVGIGAEPATGWLASSGLPIADGIECDEQLRVRGFDGIHAAGDVARWPHPRYGFPLRIEHWTNANEHGAIVAASILGKPAPREQVPYVWSDQYGHRIQIVGRPSLGTVVSLRGDVDDHLVALYADGDHVLVGGVVVDDPRGLMKIRKAITNRSKAVQLAEGINGKWR